MRNIKGNGVMGNRKKIILFFLLYGMWWAGPALAAETVFGIDRHLWSSFWRVANFLILVFLLYRWLKQPVADFFKHQHNEIVGQLESIKQTENKLAERERQQQELFDKLDAKIAEIKSYYEEVGKEEKERLLREAEVLKKKALADAEAAAEREFEEAKKKFREEVVEEAVKLAEQRIREQIGLEDHKTLIEQYIAMLEKTAQKQYS